MFMRILLSLTVIMAVAVPPQTAQAQQRVTLFEKLFPRAAAKQRARQRARWERERRARDRALAAERKRRQALARKNAPKVPASRNYAYKVDKRAPIVIKPALVTFAAAYAVSGPHEDASSGVSVEDEPTPVQISTMTRDLVDAGLPTLRAERLISKSVSQYYIDNQNYRWVNEEGKWNARARAVIAVLSDADIWGLRPEDYNVDVSVSSDIDLDPKRLARQRLVRELALTTAAMRYLMDAKFGAINPNRLSGYHSFPSKAAAVNGLLNEIMGPALPARTLLSAHPSNDKFLALKQELAFVRAAKVGADVIELKRNIFIRPGQSHQELPNVLAAVKKRASDALLAKHALFFSSYAASEIYTDGAVAAVRDYQKEAGLGPDGIIGKRTVAKLIGDKPVDRVKSVVLAMERLRWLPTSFGERHVFINQPEYRARYIEDGKEALSMRVVVGKKSNQTNFFYDEIEYVEFNPYWNVPNSIIVNEFAPKSINSPGYLDGKGYEIRNARGQQISSSAINWWDVGKYPNFSVRQPPGAKNALGSLKIMFPNKHAIYMHDTPAKSLFNRNRRAFSHGCVRLADPQAMAAAVLGKNRAHVKTSIAGGKNKTEYLAEKIPVYVSYFTAWPQADGEVKYFADMYGRDAHLAKAMEKTRTARAKPITS